MMASFFWRETYHTNRCFLRVVAHNQINLTNIKTLFTDGRRNKYIKVPSLELLDHLPNQPISIENPYKKKKRTSSCSFCAKPLLPCLSVPWPINLVARNRG